jgi:hypothetical protein
VKWFLAIPLCLMLSYPCGSAPVPRSEPKTIRFVDLPAAATFHWNRMVFVKFKLFERQDEHRRILGWSNAGRWADEYTGSPLEWWWFPNDTIVEEVRQ